MSDDDPDPDFLDAINKEFSTREEFVAYIDRAYTSGAIKGEFNIIPAVNNLRGDEDAFFEELDRHFSIMESSGRLHILRKRVDDDPVYSYVYLDDNTPIFFTNANKTDEIPHTIWSFLKETQNVGRLMLSPRKVDEIREAIVSEDERVMIPYFSARRSRDSPIDARRRGHTKRSIQYRAFDGLETYREMRYNYGILPRIMTFENPNRFKFKVKTDGTFVHMSGGLSKLWTTLSREMERVENMKVYANTANYGKKDNVFFGEEKFNISEPWAIEVDGGFESKYLKTFKKHLSEDFWEFGVSEYRYSSEFPSFEAELIDKTTNELTTMKTKGDDVRIFPREYTDIDQSLRIYNFISDHFDADCTPKQVV